MKKYIQFLILTLLYPFFVTWGQSSLEKKLPDWIVNDKGLEAGFLSVPENHDDPSGKTIQIAYAVLKSGESAPGSYPMIFFSGGPGGVTLNKGLVGFLKEHPFSKDRDIILFDQRGIGYSSALPDMSYDSFQVLAADATPEKEQQLTKTMIATYKEKCRELGIDPAYYNTIQNARDVGMLFEHLGYEKYILYGGSYGTRLARVVQDLFPGYINSAVLDSPSPLSGDFLLDRLDSYSLALTRIFQYCDASPDCSEKYPDLQSDYFKAVSRLGDYPVAVTLNDSIPFVINAQDGIYLLRRLLYQDNSREKAPELIHAFLEGSGEVINEVLQFEYQLTGGLNLTMLLSVEKFENFNPENTSEIIDAAYKNYPLIPEKLGFFDAFYQAGTDWHNANLPMEERIFTDSDIPTLIMVNRYDPVTPPKNGRLFMEKLSRGTLLILDEGGHGGGNESCKDRVIADFMKNPGTPPDVSCLNLYKG
ncbi:MAG: alpha/beta fold hydrolase [Robiginitalea sp.]